MWYNVGEDEIQHMSDDDDGDDMPLGDTHIAQGVPLDPLTGVLMGVPQSLLRYHPIHTDAMFLWKKHLENVEPLCKILHIPSTGKMIDLVSRNPETASKIDDCLLFVIYHAAVFSMSDKECNDQLRETRSTLIQRFHFAAQQALVNASFLQTTEFSVLQALCLFLLSSRHIYDPHTYWILTGTAARIGQRIGLHRDGEKLGLPPFDVEMRRRLFYQIVPLDGRASQFAGINFVSLPESWDTQPPSNINDEQIWPGMTETPVEQRGATDMIFCLSRAYIGKTLARSGNPINSTAAWNLTDHHEAEKVISAVENEVEGKFIRYCDIVNPLHHLTICLVRSCMTTMRLKIGLPKVRNQTATDAEWKELFCFAQKTLDIDAAIHVCRGTSRYRWHIKPYFSWETRDSLIFILTTLFKRHNILSAGEIDAAWATVAQHFQTHDELFDSKQALYVALRRLALKAWDSYRLISVTPEPDFVRLLRSAREEREKRQHKGDKSKYSTDATSSTGPFAADDTNASLDSLSHSLDLEIGPSSGLNVDDWVFWDQLMQDHQAPGS
ncbi:uncharacterized protein N7511_005711 [Penicillium nucicola]|uniref:uncharacterized protein n=1 Tax=Penicillium nucicola TaxID=1850975 RepID=UPI0025451849|nr:uncharacterized protein N7511_005711 [Penicillium nucicola]KAJ5762329.1 hypothetical protein N7511_005711 [Penicillium nucicola]